jgi:hypothetical protein
MNHSKTVVHGAYTTRIEDLEFAVAGLHIGHVWAATNRKAGWS